MLAITVVLLHTRLPMTESDRLTVSAILGAISEEDNLIRDFQKETNTFINPEEQIEYEENQEEIDI